MKGTLVNAAGVLLGSGLGLLIKKNIPSKYQQTLMQGLALTVGLIGLQMAFKTQNIMTVIVSVVIGSLVGEWMDIDRRLNQAGQWLGKKVGSQYGDVGQGFVTASLVYCVGAMAIVGSIQEGLTGDASTIYAKSMLDSISSVIFSSGMGIGVAFSSISILLYQGSITLLAGLLHNVISDNAIREMTAVGGLLIVGLSLIMLEIKTIKVANMLPAIFVAAFIASFT